MLKSGDTKSLERNLESQKLSADCTKENQFSGNLLVHL